MVNVEFIINDHFLVSHLITNFKHWKESVTKEQGQKFVDFINFAWDINQVLTTAFLENGLLRTVPVLSDHKFKDFGFELDVFIEELAKSQLYKELKLDTQKALVNCKEDWDKNYEFTAKYIQNMGINVDGTFRIWLVHPDLADGSNIKNRNIIWSYRNSFPNYNAIYIWHEILHSYFSENFKIKKTIEESIIQLITDNEMKKVLNGKDYPPFTGHDDTVNMMEAIYPDWKEFLLQDKKDIKQFVEIISKKFGQDS